MRVLLTHIGTDVQTGFVHSSPTLIVSTNHVQVVKLTGFIKELLSVYIFERAVIERVPNCCYNERNSPVITSSIISQPRCAAVFMARDRDRTSTGELKEILCSTCS